MHMNLNGILHGMVAKNWHSNVPKNLMLQNNSLAVCLYLNTNIYYHQNARNIVLTCFRSEFELVGNYSKQSVSRKKMKENGIVIFFNLSSRVILFLLLTVNFFFSICCRIIALRKAEKEEERRAREKIRQKLEEDKVLKMIIWHLICNSIITVMIFLYDN